MCKETKHMEMEEIIEHLKSMVFDNFKNTTHEQREALDIAINILEQVKVTTYGEWLYDAGDDECMFYICSKCGKAITKRPKEPYPPYCSRCGAKMKIKE